MAAASEHRLRWHRTTLDGRVAVYGEAGDGPPVVFVHGWGLSARTYSPALRSLAAAGTRVIAPALPGFGNSDPLDGPYTWGALADWMYDLFDHLGVDEPATLVGHSFGGGVVTVSAHRHPDRVRSLVLLNSIGGSVWKEGRRGQRRMADRPLWDWGLHVPSEWGRRGYRRVLPVVARDLLTNAVTNPTALRRAARLARTADLRSEIEDLTAAGVPVSILWGNQDRVVPEAAFLALCEAAGAPGDIIRAGGHSWLLADPDGFGEVITNSAAIHGIVADGPVDPAVHPVGDACGGPSDDRSDGPAGEPATDRLGA